MVNVNFYFKIVDNVYFFAKVKSVYIALLEIEERWQISFLEIIDIEKLHFSIRICPRPVLLETWILKTHFS